MISGCAKLRKEDRCTGHFWAIRESAGPLPEKKVALRAVSSGTRFAAGISQQLRSHADLRRFLP